jgi:tRNA pseudouridine32 synthase/23S rRNA pseudouridine746 synthase
MCARAAGASSHDDNRRVDVMHADDSLVVVDKPAGLLAVPGRGADKADCAAARIVRAFPDALVVHRLDMATSGLLAFARGIDAQRRLSRAFETRAVGKRYVAVVHGELRDDAGEIDLPLAADWPNRPRQVVDRVHGRPALTRWRVLARTPGRTRVALEPVTGRSHQLRVHLLALGHPIVGDALYGPAPVEARAHGLAPRLLLHASRLALPHPRDGAACVVESAPPF